MRLRIYLSVPIVANRDANRARAMAEAIRDSGHEVSSPWVLGPTERHLESSVDIFQRDRLGVERSDAIVADVSRPSIGVGMELMAAYHAGKRIIVTMKRGSVISGMVAFMAPKELIEFDDETDLYSSLKSLLERI
jgi:nucleoside 2-deoxyribosyltransferase